MTKVDSENTLVAIRRTDLQRLRIIAAVRGKSMIALLHDMIEDDLAQKLAIPETEKNDDAALANLFHTWLAGSPDATLRDQGANPRVQGTNPRALRVTAETE
jgi:hypothetical protein